MNYEFALEQNYPNPFNPVTTISFTIPTSPHPSPYQGEGARVRLVVYNSLGQHVATLVNETKAPGVYEVQFDANKAGLVSGVYFYKINISPRYSSIKKMLLLK